MLEVKPSGSSLPSASKYFRVAEIEFYLNDYAEAGHKDTFTHGDPMQKQTGKWYFHKFGNSYKAGTYKGVDISIGKGEGVAAGGILLRSLMPLTLATTSTAETLTFHHDSRGKSQFIEGPCNCVNRLLAESRPEEHKEPNFDIINLVGMPDFDLDIFNDDSCLHLLCSTPERQIVLPSRDVFKCPRVGLSLKRYDAEKEKFWMADYRYLTFPAFHAKMKDYIVLSLLAKGGKSMSAISEITAAKVPKIEELDINMKKGQQAAKANAKAAMKSCMQEKMTAKDWAYTYGMHTVLNP